MVVPAGVVLRALPKSWHMTESMAGAIIGEPTLWEAGSRVMQAGKPKAWNEIVAANKIRRDNHKVIAHANETRKKPESRCDTRSGSKGQK